MGNWKHILAAIAIGAVVTAGVSAPVSAFLYSGSASYLSIGSSTTGYLYSQGESDYFYFYAYSGDSIIITMDDPYYADYDMYLYSSAQDGYHYDCLTSATSSSDTTSMTYDITYYGTYYIEVYAYGWDSYDYSYDLSLDYDTYIEVTNPDSYDYWYAGSYYTIEWDYGGSTSSYVSISVDSDPYSSYYATTIASYTSNDGSYSWYIPTTFSSGYYIIRVQDYTYSSYYDDSPSFYIYGSDYIDVTNPDSYDTWYVGYSYTIEWDYSTGTSDYVTITVDSDPYSSYYATTIASYAYNDGSYSWTVPSSLSSGYYIIRVQDYSYSSYYDDSSSFYISGSDYISVTNPDSYDTWYTGYSYTIEWDYTSGTSDYVVITVDSDPYSSYYATTIASYAYNDGSYSWTVPSSISTGYYIIRVQDYTYSSYYDDSSSFYISGSNYIDVTNPDAYDSWYAGYSYDIEWDYSAGTSSYVTITVDTSPYSSYDATTIASYTSNDGYYSWTIPSTYVSGNYVIRVADSSYSSYYDDSPPFYISGGGSTTITVGSTNTGYLEDTDYYDYYQVYLYAGDIVVIELDSPAGSDFDLDLYNSGWTNLESASVTGDDTITYPVTTTGYYYIEVSSYSGSGTYALSTHYDTGGSSFPLLLIVVLIIIIVVVVAVIAAVASSKKKDVPPPMQPGADPTMYQQPYDPAMGPQQGQVTFQQWPPPPGGQQPPSP